MASKAIALIGMPGSGKTSAGRKIADKSGLVFIDTDAEIEKREGIAISEIFARKGEEYFRALETLVLREVAQNEAVISCGGGMVLRKENREALGKMRAVVYFEANEKTLTEHVGNGQGRPLLAGDAAAKIKKLLVERTPLYRECATVTVSVDGKSVDDVAYEAMQQITEINQAD